MSRPTVYGVGTKAQLLGIVRDVAIAGDDEPVAIAEREPVAEMKAAPDAEATLRLHARNVVAINRRDGKIDEVLCEAAAGDVELLRLWEDSEQQRLVGAGIVVDDVVGRAAYDPVSTAVRPPTSSGS